MLTLRNASENSQIELQECCPGLVLLYSRLKIAFDTSIPYLTIILNPMCCVSNPAGVSGSAADDPSIWEVATQ